MLFQISFFVPEVLTLQDIDPYGSIKRREKISQTVFHWTVGKLNDSHADTETGGEEEWIASSKDEKSFTKKDNRPGERLDGWEERDYRLDEERGQHWLMGAGDYAIVGLLYQDVSGDVVTVRRVRRQGRGGRRGRRGTGRRRGRG